MASGCGFVCNQGLSDCDGLASNGCETSVLGDFINCGSCGHKCYGGTCSSGQCSKDVQLVAESPGQVHSLDLDTTDVYWSTSSGTVGIYRAPKSGGAPILLASEKGYPVKVNATMVLWALNNTVKAMPKSGGPIISVITNPNIWVFDVDDTYVYWATSDTKCNCYGAPCTGILHSQIYRAKIQSNSTPELVATINSASDPTEIKLVSNNVYVPSRGCSNFQPSDGLAYASKAVLNQTNINPTFTGFSDTKAIRANSSWVFFYGGKGGNGGVWNTNGTLYHANSLTTNYDVNDAAVYVGLQKFTLANTNLGWIADNQTGVANDHTDSTYLYWSITGYTNPDSSYVAKNAIMRGK